MRAVDTNVVVRYLTNDDADQAARVRHLLAEEEIAVSLTVLLEAEWVLRAVYGLGAHDVIAGLRAFAGLPHVTVEDAATAALALDWAEHGLDFADALHLAAARSRGGFISFDKTLARAARKVAAVRVSEP